ncbi:hypothetical protein FGSG_13694 [Fusarium graminearum PH-1]|uniref:hypothetical protein n=1 Tax=Gibberella zeae (strain ATCC MYA-4620 / CBS 123657 / FGSC 9075 / NRRL 31084 / PH-1) TaxID=229533 RepID=UPI00021F1A54|nr:hypothetical protein FGSG_13694 [Fusarium graminearum PH-1]ESU16721.1 hypothetical protein FGSG_13694 [Fusarium graminearum PH-1]KAI6749034.1 hypothetical protein HG531_007981 [Fusarium graminearum]|eukprot:XP_011318983.1 hypothetical protein FGSG_13694 [Fusarium graminearum PH-1]
MTEVGKAFQPKQRTASLHITIGNLSPFRSSSQRYVVVSNELGGVTGWLGSISRSVVCALGKDKVTSSPKDLFPSLLKQDAKRQKGRFIHTSVSDVPVICGLTLAVSRAVV